MSRPAIVLFGNCQAGAFAEGLRRLPAVAERYDAVPISTFDMAQGRPERQLEAIDVGRAVMLVEQVSGTPTPDWLTERLPAGLPRLAFAPMDTNLLWPLHFSDPRNLPEPGHEFGRYPYGDRVVVDLIRRGLRGRAAFDAYRLESLRCIPDLTRLAALDARRLMGREAGAQVRVADIIVEEICRRPLFHTHNHPTGWLFAAALSRMIDLMRGLLRLPPIHDLQDRMGDYDPLSAVQTPIHPAVARRLCLAWWSPERRYRMTDGTLIGFDSYMQRYIDFV